MSAVVTQTYKKKAKPLSTCLFFLFCITAFQVTTAYGDRDCVGNNCDQDGNYWVKVKRLPDMLPLPDWNGQKSVPGNTETSGKSQFCTIAYLEGRPRTMFDPQVSIYGPASDSKYILKNGGHSVPVTLEIESVAGRAPQDKTEFKPGQSITLTGNNGFSLCRNNELIITATVRREDILKTGMTGNYRSLFRFSSESTMDGKSLGPAWMEFEVTLRILPVIQISQLGNIPLIPSGNSAKGSHRFCVYAMGSNTFSLEASSLTGTSRPEQKFALKNGDNNYINYELTVTDSKATSKSYDKNSDQEGFSATDDYQCSSTNMIVEVIVPDINKPAGTYIDTMTFTVTPD
ncbi:MULTISPECIES: hypothetical protein [unclassified Endozoicomonas]|uniref:hypothetical protein n=1 Tax=unclassified Endozoicomonas TaxID=2644528 RepID=UPI003BB4ECDD